jgi:ATP-binding cassette, subfamily B, bacterial
MLSRRLATSRQLDEYNQRRRSDAQWASKADDKGRVGGGWRKGGKPTRGFWELFRAFWSLCQGHTSYIWLSLFTVTIMTLISLALPAATKVAIDYIITDSPGPSGLPVRVLDFLGVSAAQVESHRRELLWWLGGAMVALSAVAVFVGIVGRWQMTRVTKRVQVGMRRRAFHHAIQLPLHRIQHYKSGGMSSLLREDAGLAGELLFSMIYNPWRAIITLAGTLVILAFTDWRLLAGGLLCIPAVWVTHKTWISKIRPLFRDAKQIRQQVDAHATEAFGGLRVVRGFGRSRSENARFVSGQHMMTRIEIITWWWSRIVEIAWGLLIPIASAGVMIYGGIAVMEKSLTIGDLMMFLTYLLMLLGPLETLTSTAANIQSNLAALDRVLTLLDEEKEFVSDTPTIDVDRATARGQIELRNVSFTYPVRGATDEGKAAVAEDTEKTNKTDTKADKKTKPREVLSKINLIAQAGQTIALVGPSGVGKTTLCNVVARFYDPTQGDVLLDGVNLRDISIASYRSLLGIVEQDVFLFDGTIAENIAYGRRDARESEIMNAARAAHAHDFISQTEKGYQTMIGERGVRLSGGQKQRIAIARAILADPLILILDEATSNLDSESEQLIQQSLATLMKDRTCFVIAHRLSTIRHADSIVVLEQGRVVEQGAHDQLANGAGMYAHLLSLQNQGPRVLVDE